MVHKVRVVAVLLLCFGLLSCTRPPDLVGVDNRDIPVLSVENASRHKIFIATTRAGTESVGMLYSGARASDLGLSSVVVSIPPNHVSGVIERARRLPPDPMAEFAVIAPALYGSAAAFTDMINTELAQRPPRDREILLFVHGYNNTFSDAVLRIAQFVHDTGFKGVPVLFSWASAGRASHYVYDLNSALTARPRFRQTLRLLAQSRARGIDIFAHSMGSMLTVETLIQAEADGGLAQIGRLNHVVLAAPDIDLDLFKVQLSQIGKASGKLYVFVSNDDRILGVSQRISGGVVRVGAADVEELAELGVTVIDLSEIADSASGSHNKFAASPAVVQLIGANLRLGNRDGQARPPSLTEALNNVPLVHVLVPDRASGL
ncbi:alpha/beta hydrolase [Sedimentitalea nanhaiensis]|nr:alpha/beta hydrolase [Sedimentitalea nanhaiensis]